MISPQVLQRYSYFAGAGEPALNAIAMVSKLLNLSAGSPLFSEGEKADTLFVVVKGHIDLQLTTGDGESAIVDSLVTGDLIGLSSVTEIRLRKTNAIARSPSEVIAIDAERLLKICHDNPMLGFNMLRAVAEAYSHRLRSARVQLAAAG